MKHIFISIALFCSFLLGCEDASSDSFQNSGNLKILLVDSPASFDSVIIFVKEVEVHHSGSDSISGWSSINSNPAFFDLIQLVNGASAVLGDSSLPPGDYTQIRLILNDGNYIIDNGIKHFLTIPSDIQSGIKLNHAFTIQPNTLYELILDFEVDKSIHISGNGEYIMNPVIRVIPLILSGSISGQVIPLDADASISAIIGLDTVVTYADSNGFFKLMGLPQETYSVELSPVNQAYKDTVISNVAVFVDQNTDIGTIVLQNN